MLSGETQRDYESQLRTSQRTFEEEEIKQADAERRMAAQIEAIDNEHLFRRSLLDDPVAVEFVRGDVEWLRLVLLLYGGIADSHSRTT